MKGISVWIWVMAGFIIGLLMFMISIQFLGYITAAQQKELARSNLDGLAVYINGLCNNRVGDSFSEIFSFPEKVTSVYATTDIKVSPETKRTYGNNLCMNFSNEVICDDVKCNLEMEKITIKETLQSLISLPGKFGTNSYNLNLVKTDCGIAVLPQNSTSTCTLSNTLT
jgi:hypothetical protein